jgi:restriction endonuclease S subunit
MHIINSPPVRGELSNLASGTTRQRVSGGNLKRFSLPVPPLAEQRRIVARIEALFARIRQARADLLRIAPLAQKYRDAETDRAFRADELPSGWLRRRLGQLFEFKYGRSLPERTRQPGDVPVYGSAGQVGTHNHALTAGPTVIIGRKGSVGAVQFSPTPCWPIDTTYYIDAFNGHDPVFWAWILKALDLGSLDSSTAIPGINRQDAYRLEVSVPPLAEQRRIVARIEALFARIQQIEQEATRALALLNHLERSILTRAFRGELVPQDPADEPASVSLARSQEGAPAAPRRGRPRRAA